MSEQSASFPVFGKRVEADQEAMDPLNIGDLPPDELVRRVAEEEPEPLGALGPGQVYALVPGEDVQLCDDWLPDGRRMIAVSGAGLFLYHGDVTHQFSIPAMPAGKASALPHAAKVAWVDVERAPTGHVGRGFHFVVVAARNGEVIGRLDTSNGLSPFQPSELSRLCRFAGLEFEMLGVPTVGDLLERHPDWVPPRLEFEVDHPDEEAVLETGLTIGMVVALTILIGGAGMAGFLTLTPFGVTYRILGAAGFLVAGVLGLWSLSESRERRSLAARAKGMELARQRLAAHPPR